jgi:hypothetical protein
VCLYVRVYLRKWSCVFVGFCVMVMVMMMVMAEVKMILFFKYLGYYTSLRARACINMCCVCLCVCLCVLVCASE